MVGIFWGGHPIAFQFYGFQRRYWLPLGQATVRCAVENGLWLGEPPRDLSFHERHVTRRSVLPLAEHDARPALPLLIYLVVLALLSAPHGVIVVAEHVIPARVLLHLHLLIRNHIKDGAFGQPLLLISFSDLRD